MATMTKPSGESIPRAQRKRQKFEVSISDEARERVDAWAAEVFDGNRSATVEALILQAKKPPQKIDKTE